ncbi:phosphoglycerate mutase (2,3-diphosphoglycerate-independent) [Candidatus Woesebacteria bacterium RIFCSPHIGHO2_01_FULL_44_21]|uniref:2,3-bisphosphoglycerate-independent phosphoglycerate mutase n=1 Tax=Candidatus Woesebacteria bacterium RIFCSPHIGHO2_01_FULL_44_21 TaxID=1802503 RepID=A0A1F7YXM5_9BACT|nr:MAG: phosphoglycerate mutase (2,3-diphosphoglycerate-independent) [Candidatus Woesebacteria bacterium RIFCSPHIGHO2_01_FULL_44_21]OGM70986.1 MAG: phosphoglycerate mutase (2,3-diphosphoglycerate-independent) [Candidatus Woesebacteria bacterium RIFCSPLOWO2_01_FULL_44_24b]
MFSIKFPNIFRNSLGPPISPVVLVALDGWGLAPPSKGNAISLAKTPNMDYLYSNFPHGELIASGESVGLPATEVGNSEVGHLTMGVGRVIYQSLKRINIAIEDGSFYENAAFDKATRHVLSNNSSIHLIGLVGSGNVHSNTNHLYALLQFCKKNNLSRVYLHLFCDGRDAPPNEGAGIISQIQAKLSLMKVGKIATICGRYYAMDRDARWDRVQKTYDAMTKGAGRQATDAVEVVRQSYSQGKSDEFIEPTVILENGVAHTINDNDAAVFFNFRVDRARELTMAFVLPNFEHTNVAEFGFQLEQNTTFERAKKINNLFFVTMTEYHKNFPVSAIAFPPQYNFPDSLTEILTKNNIKSLHLAESEKERMVTFYFRGMNATAFAGETTVIVPSPKVDTYDKKPEMSADALLAEFKRGIAKNIYKFVLINFANPDMVAHSGNIPATVKAIEVVDKVLGEITKIALEKEGVLVISADHGNAEELLTFPSQTFYYTTSVGEENTDHSSNPVPIVVASNQLKGRAAIVLQGTLADIAPTICAIMKLQAPASMTGKNLFGAKV